MSTILEDLLAKMEERKVHSIHVGYSGSGDSGDIDEVQVYGEGGNDAQTVGAIDEEALDSLKSLASDVAWESVDLIGANGFWNDEGGHGNVDISLRGRTAEINHVNKVRDEVRISNNRQIKDIDKLVNVLKTNGVDSCEIYGSVCWWGDVSFSVSGVIDGESAQSKVASILNDDLADNYIYGILEKLHKEEETASEEEWRGTLYINGDKVHLSSHKIVVSEDDGGSAVLSPDVFSEARPAARPR